MLDFLFQRKSCAGLYRYGFNGKERDPASEWGQTSYDYGFRIYNPEIGKFMSVDPLAPDYPWYTPYQFAGNMPIWAIDLDGLEEKKVTHYLDQHPDNTFYVVETETEIKHDISVTIDGVEYATTDVYYVVDDVTYSGGALYEEIVEGGLIPSATYDYTIEVIPGKGRDDFSYIGWRIWRYEDIIRRDLNAPDNQQTIEDLEVLEIVLPKILPKVRSNGDNFGARKGGGKNAKHKNQDAKEAAKKQYEQYNKKYQELKSMPNKTKQNKKDLETFKRQRDHFKQKMDDTGENHSQKKKGN